MCVCMCSFFVFFFFQAEDGIRDLTVTGVQTCALPIFSIGVAPLDTEAGELMHSLAAAETACKAAKDRGRNRVEVYESGDASLVRRFTDIKVLGQLRTAIDEGRLWLAAQLTLPFAGAERQRPHFELLFDRKSTRLNSTHSPNTYA